jgi:hypothetical protein
MRFSTIWQSYFVQCVLASISPVAVRLQYALRLHTGSEKEPIRLPRAARLHGIACGLGSTGGFSEHKSRSLLLRARAIFPTSRWLGRSRVGAGIYPASLVHLKVASSTMWSQG